LRIYQAYIYAAIFSLLLFPLLADGKMEEQFLIPNEIQCIQVFDDDSVNITMMNPLYSELYYSSALNGPYAQADPFIFNDGGDAIQVGAQNTQTTINWFYFFDGSDNSYSDTLANIVLDLDPLNGAGIARLTWNHPYTPAYQVPNNSFYSIMREYPLGTWSEIAQVSYNTTLYDDTITICNAFLNYKVEFNLGNSCTFISNIQGDVFANNTPPDIPQISQVSVDSVTGFITLSWVNPPQQDVQGYVIVQNIGGFSVAIDTIWDPTITSYTDINTQTQEESYAYGIAAFDTCINPNANPPFYYISPPTALNDFQRSILLETTYFGCEQYTELEWNSYINWPGGVSNYMLYVSENGNPYQLLGAFSPGDTSYVHEDVEAFSTYCYIVKVISSDGTRISLSNVACLETEYPGLPEVLYLSSTKVDSAENVQLSFYVDSESEIDIEGFIVEALYPTSTDFIEIGTLPYVDGESNYFFEDLNTSADESSIYYRIQVIDGCGNPNFYSNVINTIYLVALSDQNNAINTIIWNQAEGRAGEITGYDLYRINNGTEQLIYTAGPEEYYYEDDVSEDWMDNGAYCYFVRSREVNNPYGEFDYSQSDEYCALISPRVWIPNSFVIDGDVPYFTPVFSFAEVSEYQMTILNRWAKNIYETTDIYTGWDGYYKGNPVPQGVYIYVIQLKDGFGKFITETGSVTVFSNRE
jgi:gliding motility-associated-like protein